MWSFLAKLLFAVVISFILRPKPQTSRPEPAESPEVATAEDGRSIPVVFGRRRLSDPNVVWYGDFSSKGRYESSGGKK